MFLPAPQVSELETPTDQRQHHDRQRQVREEDELVRRAQGAGDIWKCGIDPRRAGVSVIIPPG